MANGFSDLSDKVFELCLELDKIDVLTNDLYCEYFSIIDISEPNGVEKMKYNYKASSVKSAMLREIMPDIVKLARVISEEIDNIRDEA